MDKIQIISMEELGYFAVGHHDEKEFLEALKEFELKEYGETYCDKPIVSYMWFRYTPKGPFDVNYKSCKPGRGAFPVTVVYI